MTPEQLQRAARRLRERTPQPSSGQAVGEYVRNYAVHELAATLDELACEDDTDAG